MRHLSIMAMSEPSLVAASSAATVTTTRTEKQQSTTGAVAAKKWHDSEVSLDPLKDQVIAVIGYGIQGRAQASNMKDSGMNVVVGLRKNGKTWSIAENDGHKVMEVSKAAESASIIHILIPDMEQTDTYNKEIAPYVTEGKALCFSH